MRHRVYGKHLSRTKNQRTALFKSLVQSLILSESIETTEAKAKAIKALVDKLITQAKSPNTKRLVSQFLISKNAQEKLFNDITPRLESRNSGYTSVVKLGKRLGDGSMLVKMSLLLEESQKGTKGKRDKEISQELVVDSKQLAKANQEIIIKKELKNQKSKSKSTSKKEKV